MTDSRSSGPPDDASPDWAEAAEAAEAADRCAMCGRDLWVDGLSPAGDGTAWICGECDAARNFTFLDF